MKRNTFTFIFVLFIIFIYAIYCYYNKLDAKMPAEALLIKITR